MEIEFRPTEYHMPLMECQIPEEKPQPNPLENYRRILSKSPHVGNNVLSLRYPKVPFDQINEVINNTIANAILHTEEHPEILFFCIRHTSKWSDGGKKDNYSCSIDEVTVDFFSTEKGVGAWSIDWNNDSAYSETFIHIAREEAKAREAETLQ